MHTKLGVLCVCTFEYVQELDIASINVETILR
jgi:hypothetical protein